MILNSTSNITTAFTERNAILNPRQNQAKSQNPLPSPQRSTRRPKASRNQPRRKRSLLTNRRPLTRKRNLLLHPFVKLRRKRSRPLLLLQRLARRLQFPQRLKLHRPPSRDSPRTLSRSTTTFVRNTKFLLFLGTPSSLLSIAVDPC